MLLSMSCVQTVPGGHIKEEAAFSSLKIGTTTKDEARKLLGSPSSESVFGPTTWFYVSVIKHTSSFFGPEIVDQHVTEIAFDTGGVLSSIKEYSMADSKKIQIAQRTTPTEGQQLGFFEQIMGNLGRFNKDPNANGGAPNPTVHQPPMGR